MLIDSIRRIDTDGVCRIQADVYWEELARQPQQLWFAVNRSDASLLDPCGEALLCAALQPALWNGESRIRITEPVCPLFLDNLREAVYFTRYFWNLPIGGPLIESPVRGHRVRLEAKRNAAVFFSGGVDSLFALWRNRQAYPKTHDLFVRLGVVVQLTSSSQGGAPPSVLEPLRLPDGALAIANEAGVGLLPIATNLRALATDEQNRSGFWGSKHHGSAFAAVGHALSGGIHTAFLGSSETDLRLNQWGSTPLCDSRYRSLSFDLISHGSAYSRLEKLRALAAWPTAVKNLQVCFNPPVQGGNCGRCEKCVRTRIMLIIVGVGDKPDIFDDLPLTVAHVEAVVTEDADVIAEYDSFADALERLSRTDLAVAVRDLVGRSTRHVEWKTLTGTGVYARLRRVDRRCFGGRLSAIKTRVEKAFVSR